MTHILALLLAVQALSPADDAARGANEFAFALYPRLVEADRNLFVSPLSVALALAMAHAGAAGPTREEIAKVLGYAGRPAEEVDSRCHALAAALRRTGPGVTLRIANSAWLRDGFRPRPDFVERLKAGFDAPAEALPFDAAGARRMNDWVKERTGGMIEKIVPDSLSSEDRLFLINAVHFKGIWKTSFDKAASKEKPFLLASGESKPLTFMIRAGTYVTLETEAFGAIRLPYGTDESAALYVFVPRGTSTLADLHAKLAPGAWAGWMTSFKRQERRLELPRFKAASDLKLRASLAALGMPTAFKESADFSGIAEKEDLHVSEVLHKTALDVHEEGSEAAAATAVRIGITTSARREPTPFKVDRPFFLAIRDERTGVLLFMGSIVSP